MFNSYLSLRKKILAPFFFLMLALSIILLSCILYFVSDIQNKDYLSILQKDMHFLNSWLLQKKETQVTLTNSLPNLRWRSLKQYLSEGSNDIDVFIELDGLDPFYNTAFTKLLDSDPTNDAFQPLLLSTQRNQSLIFISGVTRYDKNTRYIYCTSQRLSEQGLEQLALTSHPALFHVAKNLAEPLLMSSRIYTDPILQEAISQFLKKNHTKTNRLHLLDIKNQSFYILFQATDLQSELVSVVLIKKDSLFANGTRLFFILLGVILLTCSAVYLIYAFIIGKIVTSIDVLSDVAEKVSDGDFDQRVFLNSQDEIGRLSDTFNQMIYNLKQSAVELLQEKRKFESILKNVPVGILVMNPDNSVAVVNQEAELLFSFKQHRNYPPALMTFLSKQDLFSKPKKAIHITTYSDEKSGRKRQFELRSQILHREDTPQVLTVFRDLTHEREIDRLRDAFLRTVTHELRTPLTSVIGYIELVKKDIPKEQSAHQKYLTTALKEAQNLQQLITDLLDLSQLNAGKINMRISSINVTSFLDDIITSLQPLLKGRDLILSRRFDDENFEIKADKDKIRRILMNLCSNAIKFTQKGHIDIDVEQKNSYVYFHVSDTGIGLKKDQQEIIFDHFRQVDDTSTREYQGIGLGLAIVKELVELHKGSIKVKSTYGEGSVFTFSIEQSS